MKFRELLDESIKSKVLRTKGMRKVKVTKDTQYITKSYSNIAGSGMRKYYKIHVGWQASVNEPGDTADGIDFYSTDDGLVYNTEYIHTGTDGEETIFKLNELPKKVITAIKKYNDSIN